jgi:RNA polymerase sigma-70 factor (ECF subfamily)
MMEPADRPATRARPAWRSGDELLVALAAGDEAVFSELYDRVGGPLFGVVHRVLRDRSLAEEVVLVEVWRTAARFDPDRGSVTTWIMVMGHRRAIDRVRSEQASRDRAERVGIGDWVPPFDDVAEQAEARTERQLVREALDGLTELQREAIHLAYYGGHTYREVAELLGAPLGTIKSRIRGGLRRLGTLLWAEPDAAGGAVRYESGPAALDRRLT